MLQIGSKRFCPFFFLEERSEMLCVGGRHAPNWRPFPERNEVTDFNEISHYHKYKSECGTDFNLNERFQIQSFQPVGKESRSKIFDKISVQRVFSWSKQRNWRKTTSYLDRNKGFGRQHLRNKGTGGRQHNKPNMPLLCFL